jgi:cytochrome c-type biogenesis protein CcmH/NrfG
MKTELRALIIALSLLTAPLTMLSGAAFAAGDPGGPREVRDPVIDAYTAAAERKDWTAAAAALENGLRASPENADYHNLLAYSIRKGPNPDMSLVFKHYNEALRIDPKHRGAHEYLGEAYLQVGNLAKAREELAQLDKICFFGCSEFNTLKKAIAEHEAKVSKQ